jgi:hypothetical protein
MACVIACSVHITHCYNPLYGYVISHIFKVKDNIKYWIILKCVAAVLLCIVRSMKRSIASQKDRPFGHICPIQYGQGAGVLLACSQGISAFTERVRLVQFTR